VGDLRALPFAPDVFSAVWSFSVLQHAHRRFVASCLDGIQRSLKPGGFVQLEFPTRWGLRNILTRAFRRVNEDEACSTHTRVCFSEYCVDVLFFGVLVWSAWTASVVLLFFFAGMFSAPGRCAAMISTSYNACRADAGKCMRGSAVHPRRSSLPWKNPF